MISSKTFDSLLSALIPVCHEAGDAIMEIFKRGEVAVRHKRDASPVTEADEAAEAIILSALKKLAPGVLVVAEECASRDGLPTGQYEEFFLVDPLDGTREFISKRDAFTVNIALIQNRRPVLGLVYAPARDALYYGSIGSGAYKIDSTDGAPHQITVRTVDPLRPAIVASRSHRDAKTDAYLENYPGAKLISIGSSLKFCLVAEGLADLYPRLGPTMEWDTGAGHAVLAAAGGEVFDSGGKPFLYGKEGFKNGFFIARGDAAIPIAPIPRKAFTRDE